MGASLSWWSRAGAGRSGRRLGAAAAVGAQPVAVAAGLTARDRMSTSEAADEPGADASRPLDDGQDARPRSASCCTGASRHS